MMHSRNVFTVALTSLLLIGCGPTNVLVKGDFPEALTEEIPLVAGVHFDDEFSNYTFTNDKKLSINLGDSQKRLFGLVLADVFQDVALLESVPVEQSAVDLVVSPHVEEMQVAVPRDTTLNIYEVWIKYNIQVFDGSGQPVADWLMTSYGKTVDGFLSSKKAALNQATIMALRDVGVQLVTKFPRVPEVQNWLELQLATQAIESGEEA